jgi:hypothetical protein
MADSDRGERKHRASALAASEGDHSLEQQHGRWLSDWVLVAIQQDAEGWHQLEEPIVATPGSDGEDLQRSP